MCRALIHSATVFGLSFAACGDGGEVAEIPFSKVRQAKDGEPQAPESQAKTIEGKRVRWTGPVRERLRYRWQTLMATIEGSGEQAQHQ